MVTLIEKGATERSLQWPHLCFMGSLDVTVSELCIDHQALPATSALISSILSIFIMYFPCGIILNPGDGLQYFCHVMVSFLNVLKSNSQLMIDEIA